MAHGTVSESHQGIGVCKNQLKQNNLTENLNTYDLTDCELYTSCYPCPQCLSAIIWANIKKVYYGNTKEDAADIGFRDDMIYKYLEDPENHKDVLELEQMDRDHTIQAFEEFKNKQDKTIY